MSIRKSIKEFLKDHKIAALLVIAVLIVGGSIGTYFVIDYINAQNPKRITLATTTSTYDSGLLDFLLPKFTEKTGIMVSILSVGTGEAITLGKDGNADVLLVHSRSRENDFVNASLGVNGVPYGLHRACVMYNDFIFVGLESNNADLQEGDDITTVMTKLRDAMDVGNITFYSRADGSGTHSKELSLWKLISVVPDVRWPESPTIYAETGAGMADTLTITYNDNEDNGYTIIDRGTWLAWNDTYTEMKVLAESIEGESSLLNPYGVIPVNPILYPHVNYVSACRFVGFLTSNYGQSLIESYTKNNEVLFYADFGTCDFDTGCSTMDNEAAIWTAFQAEFDG